MATPNLLSIQTVTPTVVESAQLASGDVAAYTVPANKAAQIKTFSLCNTTASAVTVSVSIIPSGGTADGSHKLVSSFLLAANDTLDVTMLQGAWLGAGDFINVNSGTASAVDAVGTALVFA